LQTFDKGVIDFLVIELDYKLHFFPALRAVVNAGFDQSDGKDHDMHLHFTVTWSNNDIPFGTNEFSKVKEKQAA
jgi:iron complex outermembrane receptor protein